MSDEGFGKVFVHWWPSRRHPGLYAVSFALERTWTINGDDVSAFAVVDDFGDLVRVPR